MKVTRYVQPRSGFFGAELEQLRRPQNSEDPVDNFQIVNRFLELESSVSSNSGKGDNGENFGCP